MAGLGEASAVIQVAQVGLALAQTLYKFGPDVKDARTELEAIARDVTLTSNVLKQTHEQIRADQQANLCKDDAVQDFESVLSGCLDAFQRVKDELDRAGRVGGDGKMVVSLGKRLQWGLNQKKKMEVLRANLEKLKSTLLLMLSVFALRRKVTTTIEAQSDKFVVERLQIENLVQAKDDATLKYEQLTAAFAKLETKINDSHERFPNG